MFKFLLIACERGGGAWPPVAALCEALVHEGHSVIVLCDKLIKDSFAGADILLVPHEVESRSFIENVFTTEIIPRLENGEPVESLFNPMERWGDAVAPLVAEKVTATKPDIVIGSIFGLPLATNLARQLDVPVVGINPGVYVGPNPPRPLKDDYIGVNLWFFEQFVLPPLLKSDMVLHATDQKFDLGFKTLPNTHHYIGPLIWSPSGTIPSEMTEPGLPWITAAVSMVSQEGEIDLLQMILEAADQLPARILLTAPDHDYSALAVPTNVKLMGFVSHSEALKHSSLVLSHAGHGMVMRALWMGIPMVLTPWDRDQPAVAYRAARLGVARSIDREELTADSLHTTLATALDDSELHRNSRMEGERLRATNPGRFAVNLLTQFLSKTKEPVNP
jgi:UDP:flavonoid glycosyltransferase YjiC (YdhE family)